MKILNKYKNGNVTITLYDDGTKIQEWDDNETPQPEFPVSIDVKITNYCDLGCQFCHEMSTKEGKHCNLDKLKEVLDNLPAGTELSFGGGNALDHPDILDLLIYCKLKGFVSNMTVNSLHLRKFNTTLNAKINSKLIYGLGISILDSFDLDKINLIQNKNNVVYHVIAGVNNISILDKIKESSVNKVLVLGYKEVGRGKDYFSDSVIDKKKEWRENIHKYIGKLGISLDNLAISQLDIKRFFPENKWKNMYMGEEGQFTMYIDAVKEEYSTSSTHKERFKIDGKIDKLFKKIREINNFE